VRGQGVRRRAARDQRLRRALLLAAPPDEIAAQRRSWQLARTAFDEREPTPWPQRNARGLVAAAAAVAILASVLSPPGRAVISDVRDALGTDKVAGVPQARPAIFSLPAKGRLLTTAPTGSWIVAADGSKRRLGDYDEASWSPRGLHVVASTRSQLVALTPKGETRWSLARPRVHDARWSPSGFRVAYLSGANLRMVGGDGTDDGRLGGALAVAPAWRPVEEHVLAYVDRGENLTVLEADTAETLWSTATGADPLHLEWSSDGSRLLVANTTDGGRFTLAVYDEGGRRLQSLIFPGRFADAAFSPDDHRIALARQRAGRSELLLVDGDVLRRQQPVFSGAGRFSDLAWAPGGRWLVLGWQSADQWLFIRSTEVEKIKAVSSLRKQFDPGGTGAGAFPRIEGWCCPG
jgi:dipeptidyl aminopeptidase/acylaminoacyl peptidase